MATGSAQVTIRGRFPAGTRVRLVPRNSDVFNAPGNAVATAKVGKDSEVTFGGLEDGAAFWVTAEVEGTWRSAAVTAKVPVAPKVRQDRPSTEEAAPPAPRGPELEVDETKLPKGETDPAPYMRQQDVPKGVVQRSCTPLGMATPIPEGEFSPTVPQDAVKKGTVQRSDTPFGEATPIPPGELDVAPAREQGDAKGVQRSDTPAGVATPKRAKKAAGRRVKKAGKS